MRALVSQITGVSIVCSAVCSGIGQRKHQSTASLAFVRGNHRWPVDSPHTGPVTRKMFPFGDVIMLTKSSGEIAHCQSLQIAHIPPSWLKREVCLRKKLTVFISKTKLGTENVFNYTWTCGFQTYSNTVEYPMYPLLLWLSIITVHCHSNGSDTICSVVFPGMFIQSRNHKCTIFVDINCCRQKTCLNSAFHFRKRNRRWCHIYFNPCDNILK